MKRTCCAALLMFAACGSDKSTPAPTEVAPPATGEKPDIDPDDLRKIAYTAITEDGKAFVYVVFPPYTKIGDSTRPSPKIYDLDGNRVFPRIDKVVLGLALRLAEAKGEKTIVASEFMAEDVRTFRRR